ncbi:hypothetical protein BJ170DRAFT_425138 [Xylariales sp. AK1849]|nr:hypothetical protein BJ170DRAFT_425138 [Xylariales sp. AK1849]
MIALLAVLWLFSRGTNTNCSWVEFVEELFLGHYGGSYLHTGSAIDRITHSHGSRATPELLPETAAHYKVSSQSPRTGCGVSAQGLRGSPGSGGNSDAGVDDNRGNRFNILE